MRKYHLQVLCCSLVLLTNISLAHAAPTCSVIVSCQNPAVGNGCDIMMDWTQCDGTSGYRHSTCRNQGCVQDCCCACTTDGSITTGYIINWYDNCTNSYKSTNFSCAGC